MQTYWAVLYIAVAIMAANGNAQNLRIDVTPIQTRFSGAQNVNVILKYSNTGRDTMAIYKWCLPEHGLYDSVFEVTRNGEHVNYVGPLAKRRAPTADDLIYLTPGMTVSTVVEVSSVYNMTQTGNYMIQFKMNADQVLLKTDSMLRNQIMSSDGDQGSVLQSAPVGVFAVGHRNLLIEQAIEANTNTRALTPTFASCTTAQTSSIRTAITAAESYTNSGVQYLGGQSSATQRFTTWFGTYSATNWLTLKSHFSKIQSALSTKTLSFDCSCPGAGSDTYAYVYPSQHYKIFLCNQFWQAPASGTDTKGGTIIHELAHFTILSGTSDYAYGQSAAQNLARSSPTRALANSDSLQYFIENSPRLN